MSHQVEESDQIPPEVLAEGYETRDLNVNVVWAWTIGILLTVAVSYVVLNELFHHQLNALMQERVLGAPSPELDQKNAAEAGRLSTSGVVSQEKGIYHIPITVAMEKIAAEDARRRAAATP